MSATLRRNVIRVSDHALLRFVERAGGLDIEAVRTAIESGLKRAVDVAGKLDAEDYTILADGLRYVVVNGVVVTITRQHGK